MNALLTWYQGREAREQRMLLIGAIAVPLILLVFALTALQRSSVAAELRLQSRQQDLAWLRANAAQFSTLPVPGARGNESLVTLIDRVARETGMAQSLTGSQSSGNGGLRVRAEKAGFDALVAFLGALSTQHAVIIDSATVESSGAAGIVNATLVLRKPGS
jgi:type II secretory pathway component PulM